MKPPSRDLVPWITVAPDYAPRERRPSLFDRAPHWLVMTVTWVMVLIGCFGFWALALYKATEFLP